MRCVIVPIFCFVFVFCECREPSGIHASDFATQAIHVGQEPDPTTGAIVPPVYLTSTYVQEAPGQTRGYDYTRAGNPNFTNLERQLAALENGAYATVFSSGLGSLSALVGSLKVGDTVIALNGLYGGTYRLLTKVFGPLGINLRLLPIGDWEQLASEIAKKPAMVLLESPTNPLLEVTDIARVTALAHRNHVTTVVDNTFATPYFQRPLDLGADVVVHSTTKYIGGHTDVVGGVVVTNDLAIKKQMDFMRMAMGLNPSPFDCWLTARGVKTLAVRMEKHTANAEAIARYLANHPKVARVYYPGLKQHPSHKTAAKQMSGYGGIVSAEFDLSLDEVKRLISSLDLFALAESLGGVESLVDHPASMTHASIPKGEREKMGLPDGLVRFSVGIEAADDLIADLDKALKRIGG